MAVEEHVSLDISAVQASVILLLSKIQSGVADEIKGAVMELRLLSKWDMKNRIVIAESGGIPVLVSLLCSSDSEIQENAVSALLNLSIYPANRTAIMETSGALESIEEVLRVGATAEAKENVTALLWSLLIVEKYRDMVGRNSSIVVSLQDLLRNGRVQGKKDALKAVFHLALWPDNRSRLARAGIILQLLALLKSPRAGLIEDTLSVLAQLARCKEGTNGIKDTATVSLIVEFLKQGTRLAKENAASLLLALCQTGGVPVEEEVRKHKNTIVGVLCTLLSVGSQRAKGKANELMKVVVTSGNFSGSCE